jgi:hypothetical protein
MTADVYNPFPQLNKCAAISEGGENKKAGWKGDGVRCNWMFCVCYYLSIFSPSFALTISSMLYPPTFTHPFLFNNRTAFSKKLRNFEAAVHDNTPMLDIHMHMQIIKTEWTVIIKCVILPHCVSFEVFTASNWRLWSSGLLHRVAGLLNPWRWRWYTPSH